MISKTCLKETYITWSIGSPAEDDVHVHVSFGEESHLLLCGAYLLYLINKEQ